MQYFNARSSCFFKILFKEEILLDGYKVKSAKEQETRDVRETRDLQDKNQRWTKEREKIDTEQQGNLKSQS